MKAASVMTMALCPLPTANSVPEAQAPPSCIPTPKRKAPMSTPAPMGASEAAGATPPYDAPVARIGANRVAATASISMCARRPAPWRTEASWRQAEVKPKREWNSTNPKASPTTNSVVTTPPAWRNTTPPEGEGRQQAAEDDPRLRRVRPGGRLGRLVG